MPTPCRQEPAMTIVIRIAAAAVLVAVSVLGARAHADSYLPQIGGSGGAQYRERCPQGHVLNGFELRDRPRRSPQEAFHRIRFLQGVTK